MINGIQRGYKAYTMQWETLINAYLCNGKTLRSSLEFYTKDMFRQDYSNSYLYHYAYRIISDFLNNLVADYLVSSGN